MKNERIIAAVSYFTWIGWVIALVLNINDKTKLGTFHIRQSLFLLVVMSIFAFIKFLSWIAGIGCLILAIIGIIDALNGRQKPLPIIGKLSQQWLKAL